MYEVEFHENGQICVVNSLSPKKATYNDLFKYLLNWMPERGDLK
jgi:hypothetical protein